MHAQHSAFMFHVKPDIDGATDQFSMSEPRPLAHTLLPFTISWCAAERPYGASEAR